MFSNIIIIRNTQKRRAGKIQFMNIKTLAIYV